LKISDDLKKRLLVEMGFCIEKMSETDNLRKKLYYFSGVYGAVERIMRLDFDPQLLLVHAALNVCYAQIMDLIASREHGDIVREVPADLPEKLIEYVKELADEIAQDKETYKTLEKFMELAYGTSGPGYYTLQFMRQLRTQQN